jgi:tyrosyl-tRNA synthetase
MEPLLAELTWRGLVENLTPGLKERLAQGPITGYVGFDPTAPSLQIGNLVPVVLLAHLQRAGGKPIVVIGAGTGMIGDPSGKRSERPLLEESAIQENADRQRRQLERFLDFTSGPQRAEVVNNADWLTQLNLVSFLRDIGKHFTLSYMLQKESVKSRLEEGISYTEFSYMMLQAYDFLQLYRHNGCELQLGGSDQWGNITAGRELIRRVEGGEAHGLTAPLLTASGGSKFGKTEEGSVWLDPEMTSPYRFHQFWVNVDDRDVMSYLSMRGAPRRASRTRRWPTTSPPASTGSRPPRARKRRHGSCSARWTPVRPMRPRGRCCHGGYRAGRSPLPTRSRRWSWWPSRASPSRRATLGGCCSRAACR